MAIKIRKQAPASVAVPLSTHSQFFVDPADDAPKLKDSFGGVRTIGDSYTPANPADWAGIPPNTTPTTVTEALDALASAVAGLLVPPLP